MLAFLVDHMYLTGSILACVLWLPVILKSKKKKELIIMGIVFGLGAVAIGQLYALSDYWSPSYLLGQSLPLEDFLYGFFFGGFLVGIHDILHKPVFYEDRKPNYLLGLGILIFTAVLFYVSVNLLNINSIVAHIVPPVIVGILVVVQYPHLFKHMLINMLIGLIVTTGAFQILLLIDPSFIGDIWMIENLSGIFLFGTPIEEYFFAAALGFGSPFFYEVSKGHIPHWLKD